MEKIKWIFRVIWEFLFPKKCKKRQYTPYNNKCSIMSFNIRRDVVKDGTNNWKYRKNPIIEMLDRTAPSVICLQECMPHMWKFLKKNLSKYNGYFTDIITKIVSIIPFSEGIGILYSKKYYCISKGYIKLSDKFGIDTKHWRVCQYVNLYNKFTGNIFWVFNTHLDHKDKEARKEGCAKIHKFIQENCADESVFICGDFNEEIYPGCSLEVLTKHYSKFKIYEEGTYNGFGKASKCIDFIFTNHPKEVVNYMIINKYKVNYLSDHNPIMVFI